MNPLFQKRRDKIFNLKAMRESRSVTTMPDAVNVAELIGTDEGKEKQPKTRKAAPSQEPAPALAIESHGLW